MTTGISFNGRTLIMGILNVTPDSFYDGGRYLDRNKAIDRAYQMEDDGADIIDIGGESTRPGALPVSEQEEIDRVCPVIEALQGNIKVPLSVDTCKSAVARAAIRGGVSMVNDISGLTFDGDMPGVIRDGDCYAVIMHIRGTPENMQSDTRYDDLMGEITDSLKRSVERALGVGIASKRIILDPGIGFGKSLEDNYVILKNLGKIESLGYPVMIGLSRKSLIGKLYDRDYDRLPATVALNSICVYNGVKIIRVHDVAEHRLALRAVEMLMK